MTNKFVSGVKVDAEKHYKFDKYLTKGRWISLWHQIHEVVKLNPSNVLEIGVGSRILALMLQHLNVPCKTVDIDPVLYPDYVASVLELPIKDKAFVMVVCFQVLEHLPFEHFTPALREIARVSSKYVICSLPDARRVWTYSVHIPGIQNVRFHLPRPQVRSRARLDSDEHYWEINMKNWPLKLIVECIKESGLQLMRTYRVHENPYHRFFICKTR